jgi:L-fucose mutarotase
VLTTRLTHPQTLSALAAAGHGSLVLITDGNYPATTRRGPSAQIVQMNLGPGIVDAVTVLQHVLSAVPIEQAMVMQPMTEGPYALSEEPAIWSEFRAAFKTAGVACELEPVERFLFYELGSSPDVALTIVSGESRIYGNVLLRIGVVFPPPA